MRQIALPFCSFVDTFTGDSLYPLQRSEVLERVDLRSNKGGNYDGMGSLDPSILGGLLASVRGSIEIFNLPHRRLRGPGETWGWGNR